MCDGLRAEPGTSTGDATKSVAIGVVRVQPKVAWHERPIPLPHGAKTRPFRPCLAAAACVYISLCHCSGDGRAETLVAVESELEFDDADVHAVVARFPAETLVVAAFDFDDAATCGPFPCPFASGPAPPSAPATATAPRARIQARLQRFGQRRRCGLEALERAAAGRRRGGRLSEKERGGEGEREELRKVPEEVQQRKQRP